MLILGEFQGNRESSGIIISPDTVFHYVKIALLQFGFCVILFIIGRCDNMMITKPQKIENNDEVAKLVFYRLIDEGYKAMQDGRESTLDNIVEKVEKRRAERD